MSKKTAYSLTWVIVLIGVLGVSIDVHEVKAQDSIIFIRANGLIEPLIGEINTTDNITYTLTASINASIYIERNNTILDGNGFTLNGLWQHCGFNLTNVSNVTIKNVKILNFGYAVWLQGSDHCIISSNNAIDNEGGIWLVSSTDNTVSDNTVRGSIEAVALDSSSGNNITGNDIVGSYQYGVYVRSNSAGNTISGNNITATGSGAGIYLNGSLNNVISRNNLQDSPNEHIGLFSSSNNSVFENNLTNSTSDVGIYVYACSLNRFYDNNITSSANSGIRLDLSSDSTISENHISKNLNGVYLWYSSNITISENNITGNSQQGIYLYSSNENAILSNEFYANPSAGIRLSSSSNNTIQKNTNFSGYVTQYGIVVWTGSDRNIVSENTLSPYWRGIAIGYSDGNRILSNIVSNTEIVGIQIQQDCNNSIIANNVISHSSLYGISISSEGEAIRHNIIRGNTLAHNLVGIHVARLSGNVICHNNFVDNTNQASVSNSSNIWDDGVEGNYWSNYTGVDLDHDGMGDTPQVINGNNTDYHPLMGMFHSFNTSLGKSVNVISNSTVDNFQYDSPSTIRFHVSNTTASQTHGFCRVSIPDEVLSEPFNVTIDGANPTFWNYTLYDNGTHHGIYFEYAHSTREVVIIPDAPALMMLPLVMIISLLATLAYRRRNA